MGFYSSHTILQEAKRMGIPIHGIDVNRSEADFTVETAEVIPSDTRQSGLA
jgi:DNA polymerase III alpha subunit